MSVGEALCALESVCSAWVSLDASSRTDIQSFCFGIPTGVASCHLLDTAWIGAREMAPVRNRAHRDASHPPVKDRSRPPRPPFCVFFGLLRSTPTPEGLRLHAFRPFFDFELVLQAAPQARRLVRCITAQPATLLLAECGSKCPPAFARACLPPAAARALARWRQSGQTPPPAG